MSTPNKTLKNKLWRYFSLFVRGRDNYLCISCGKQLERNTSQAGHFFPRTTGLALYFDERNVNCQCLACNVFKAGNLSAYAVALRAKYGPDILEELDAERRKTRKFTRAEYQTLIDQYKKRCEELGYEA
jgi:hypothetical protein